MMMWKLRYSIGDDGLTSAIPLPNALKCADAADEVVLAGVG